MTEPTANVVVWKHIGLHGHSMGTLTLSKERLMWKGALTGGTAYDNDNYAGSMVRSIPAKQMAAAQWTVFGRSGHLRIQTKQQQQQQQTTEEAGGGGGSSSKSTLPHELRFDGFPANDVDVLKDALQEMFGIAMQMYNMSAAGTQYGLASVKGKNLVFRHCVLDEMNEEGQEFEPRAEDEMMSLNLADVSQCVLPGNNRNEIEVQFPESDAVEAGTDQLGTYSFCTISCCFLLFLSLSLLNPMTMLCLFINGIYLSLSFLFPLSLLLVPSIFLQSPFDFIFLLI